MGAWGCSNKTLAAPLVLHVWHSNATVAFVQEKDVKVVPACTSRGWVANVSLSVEPDSIWTLTTTTGQRKDARGVSSGAIARPKRCPDHLGAASASAKRSTQETVLADRHRTSPVAGSHMHRVAHFRVTPGYGRAFVSCVTITITITQHHHHHHTHTHTHTHTKTHNIACTHHEDQRCGRP